MGIKQIYACVLKTITFVAGIDAAKVFDTRFRDHKKINLKNPQTLSDKVSYIALHEQTLLESKCSDKYAVRKYIEDKELADILVPIYGEAYCRFDDIDFDNLPNSFVLKATHGCKMNYLVPDKSKLNIEDCRNG